MANAKPIMQFRVNSVRAAIWENDGKNGTWHNVTLARTYVDENGNPKDSTSFAPGDLLAAAKALDLAHTWCLENKPQS